MAHDSPNPAIQRTPATAADLFAAYEFPSLFRTKIPKSKNEDEEREFWAGHFPPDYFDLSKEGPMAMKILLH